MSKIKLESNTSGTGTFTIASPNSNNDRTFNLPDEAGTVVTTATDIESQVKTATNATGSAPIYACRAWVNFDGTGTVAIRESGNVSSITDNATGDYTVNFTTAMPDANYATMLSAVQRDLASSHNNSLGYYTTDNTNASTYTTTSLRIMKKLSSGTTSDVSHLSVAIFR